MSQAINPETTVGALLDAYPELEGVLIEIAPAFAKLRNPVIRRTVAKVATLEQAAKLGGISLQALILRLRVSAGQNDQELNAPDVGQPIDSPSFCVNDCHVVEEINADAMLERGVHPIGRVRQAVGGLAHGELVLLTSSFRPEPLIETMRRSGVAVHSSMQGSKHFTYFGTRA